ncbi:MAG: sterol desaturase family protein [Cyclobacteriaceae bacterium]|jgi:sterol desaturase/sphingolipid hydroxylase (fatty acid hydroxylase superfamily)|nr:sterol desaturase family protein [Cyclobacteriaceae bacterium]
MENFLSFFENMPTWQRAAWIVICLSVCWVLEGNMPLFRFNYKKWKHAGVNFVFLGTTMIINIFFGIATVGVFEWISREKLGLMHYVSLPTWAELIICLFIFELVAQYTVHFMLHRFKWMWKFHMIHHSDTHLDATSGTRHHPGDFALREIFALGAVIITGAPAAFYFFYRILTVFFTYFTHANIYLPPWLDKPLSYIFITPNVHKFHHHYERPWTDSNFGNMFSIWDRLFGTFVYDDPHKIRYGLDVLPDEKDEDIAYQFKIPFNKSIKTDY